jgi:hypothetical protein
MHPAGAMAFPSRGAAQPRGKAAAVVGEDVARHLLLLLLQEDHHLTIRTVSSVGMSAYRRQVTSCSCRGTVSEADASEPCKRRVFFPFDNNIELDKTSSLQQK